MTDFSSTPEEQKAAIDLIVGFIPYVETANDLLTVTTGCGIGCRMTGVEDTSSDRRWAAVGLASPVGGRVLGAAAGGIQVRIPRGSTLLPNRMKGSLTDELSLASQKGVRPITPNANDDVFEELANSGEILKWGIDANGEVRVVGKMSGQDEISHSVLFDGADLAATGEMQAIVHDGQIIILDINNHSGHYHPTEDTLNWAVDELRNLGWVIPESSVNARN